MRACYFKINHYYVGCYACGDQLREIVRGYQRCWYESWRIQDRIRLTNLRY